MDTSKQPGVNFKGVELQALRFKRLGPVPAQILFGPTISMEALLSEDEREMEFHLTMNVFAGVPAADNPPAELEVTLAGHFAVAGEGNMSLRVFGKENAPALLFPYVREILSNITSRTALPMLNLAPINVVALVQHR